MHETTFIVGFHTVHKCLVQFLFVQANAIMISQMQNTDNVGTSVVPMFRGDSKINIGTNNKILRGSFENQ